MYSPIPFTLIPDVNPNISFPWAVFTLVINNQSNCWLTYKGNVIADPGQQSVWVFPASDANPDLQLTSTTALQTEANPLGSCQIQALYERLDPNPGVMGYAGRSGISVIQNLKLLATLSADVSKPIVVETVSIDASAQTIIAVCQANIGAASGAIDITFDGIGLVNQAIAPLQVAYAAAFPVIDNQVTLEVDYAGPAVPGHQCDVVFLSSPAPVLQIANGVLLPIQIDAKDGNGVTVAVGAAYDYPTSGAAVLASDRPLDTWAVTVVGVGGAALNLVRPAQGAGLINVCTGYSITLLNGGAATTFGNATLTGAVAVTHSFGAPANDSKGIALEDTRTPSAANGALTITSDVPPATASWTAAMHGYVVQTPQH